MFGSQHLACCAVNTSYAGGDMYFTCHVTQQDHSIEMSCIFMGKSSSQYVTTLKSLLTIGILIVKEAVAQRFSVEKVFLEISQSLLEITCARVSFLIKLQALAC